METTSSNSTPSGLLERFNVWIQESIMIKLFSIGFLVLILLIPSAWIQSLIFERQQRAEEVMKEVADKWSGSQTVSGPILVIPFKKREVIDRGKDGVETRENLERAFFLPEELDITAKVNPEILHRGIFDAVVYGSSLDVSSQFAKPDFKTLSVEDAMVLWNDAYMIFGLTDLRGISENPLFHVGEKALIPEPSNNIGVIIKSAAKEPFTETTASRYRHDNTNSTTGIKTKLNWLSADDFNGKVDVKLNLKGSRRLDFIPVGKTTSVKLSGAWADPSFDGEFLPATREVTDSGFVARWKVLHFNRPFSQQWTQQNQELNGADFGVRLLIPVDQYQKSIRSAKYGILIILLTFIALFMVEITQKIRIHPFQYILIGAALMIYYTLLISFSEHIGYNLSYIVASLATVILISLYATTFLADKKLLFLLTFLLLVFYTFIFVIILQQDYSLLLGSVGLFIIIGMLMYFSRKVRWYSH